MGQYICDIWYPDENDFAEGAKQSASQSGPFLDQVYYCRSCHQTSTYFSSEPRRECPDCKSFNIELTTRGVAWARWKQHNPQHSINPTGEKAPGTYR